jgi:hypothetical protein
MMSIRQIWMTLVFISFSYGQFGEVKVVFDNRLLKVHHQQNILPLKQDIVRYIKTTRWDEDYTDLLIPLHIQFIFEGAAQKGAQETFLAQVLFSTGIDQRYFDKSVQFPYGQGGTLYFDIVQFDPLSSFLAYYVNLILAGEIDTYELMGGTRIFEMSREIALRGTASDFSRGWSERAKLVDNISTNYGLRKAKLSFYYAMELFRDGEMDEAILEFKKMIKGLDEVYDRSPREHYTLLFLKAHTNELAKILQLMGQKSMLRDMMELDPDNSEIYKKALY